MRKFMKGCAITALVMILVGAVLAGVAGGIQGPASISDIVNAATHGNVNVNLNDWKDWGVTVGDNVFEELDKVNYDIHDNMIFDTHYEIMKGDVDKYYVGSYSDIQKLSVEVGGCIMVLKESEDSDFHVEAENTGKFQCFVKNHTVYVKAVSSARQWVDIEKCRIILYVPANFYFKELDIELGAGLLELGTVVSEKMDLEVGAGQINGDLIQADKLDVEVGMGEILLNEIQVRKLDAEVGMGALTLSGNINEKADVECSMGSIVMELAGKEQDYNYDIQGAMGSVTIGSQEFSGMAQEKKILNNAGRSIEVECSMGSIEILFQD